MLNNKYSNLERVTIKELNKYINIIYIKYSNWERVTIEEFYKAVYRALLLFLIYDNNRPNESKNSLDMLLQMIQALNVSVQIMENNVTKSIV